MLGFTPCHNNWKHKLLYIISKSQVVVRDFGQEFKLDYNKFVACFECPMFQLTPTQSDRRQRNTLMSGGLFALNS